MIEISVTYSQRVDMGGGRTMIGLSDNISLAFLRTTFVKLYVENEFICLISDAEEFSAVRRDVSKKETFSPLAKSIKLSAFFTHHNRQSPVFSCSQFQASLIDS